MSCKVSFIGLGVMGYPMAEDLKGQENYNYADPIAVNA